MILLNDSKKIVDKRHPLHILVLFLQRFAAFDWAHDTVTIWGPVSTDKLWGEPVTLDDGANSLGNFFPKKIMTEVDCALVRQYAVQSRPSATTSKAAHEGQGTDVGSNLDSLGFQIRSLLHIYVCEKIFVVVERKGCRYPFAWLRFSSVSRLQTTFYLFFIFYF